MSDMKVAGERMVMLNYTVAYWTWQGVNGSLVLSSGQCLVVSIICLEPLKFVRKYHRWVQTKTLSDEAMRGCGSGN